jgi:hypothetical protein
MLSDEQRIGSLEREQAYDSLHPPKFQEKTGTMLFDLDQRLLYLDRVSGLAQSEGFVPKNEFHVTIIGFRSGRKILEALKHFSASERDQKMQQIQQLADETDWALASKPKLYRVSKEYQAKNPETGSPETEKRETIVQTLDLENLNNFSHRLSGIVGEDIVPQFTHLTLFTKGTHPERSKMGIGIDIEEDFKKLNPELMAS